MPPEPQLIAPMDVSAGLALLLMAILPLGILPLGILRPTRRPFFFAMQSMALIAAFRFAALGLQ